MTKVGAFRKLFVDYEKQLRAKGYEPRKGQIADATVVTALRRWITDEIKLRAKMGESPAKIWPDKPE